MANALFVRKGFLNEPSCASACVGCWRREESRQRNSIEEFLDRASVMERIVPYPACERPGTARVPSSHSLDTSSTKGDTCKRPLSRMSDVGDGLVDAVFDLCDGP